MNERLMWRKRALGVEGRDGDTLGSAALNLATGGVASMLIDRPTGLRPPAPAAPLHEGADNLASLDLGGLLDGGPTLDRLDGSGPIPSGPRPPLDSSNGHASPSFSSARDDGAPLVSHSQPEPSPSWSETEGVVVQPSYGSDGFGSDAADRPGPWELRDPAVLLGGEGAEEFLPRPPDPTPPVQGEPVDQPSPPTTTGGDWEE